MPLLVLVIVPVTVMPSGMIMAEFSSRIARVFPVKSRLERRMFRATAVPEFPRNRIPPVWVTVTAPSTWAGR